MRCKFEGEVTLDAEQYSRLKRGPDMHAATDSIAESDAIKIAMRAIQLYAERHPRPVQVTITQAAQMLGLSPPTVRKLMKAGKLSFNGCGLIPIEQVDAVLACDSRSRATL
jgi:excisionase family DNA binding protein